MDSFLRQQIDTLGIPGAAIAVVQDGVQVHSAAFGRADDYGRPMTAQTPVLQASTNKTLAAIAAMQQLETVRLRLDEPVRTYLPWFALDDSRPSAISVRHLLHQANGMAAKDTAFEAADGQGLRPPQRRRVLRRRRPRPKRQGVRRLPQCSASPC